MTNAEATSLRAALTSDPWLEYRALCKQHGLRFNHRIGGNPAQKAVNDAWYRGWIGTFERLNDQD